MALGQAFDHSVSLSGGIQVSQRVRDSNRQPGKQLTAIGPRAVGRHVGLGTGIVSPIQSVAVLHLFFL